MKLRQLLLLLLASLYLTGCASSLTPADQARIKRVGVVSLVGDSVRGSYVGLTVFNNHYYDAPVPDFAIDQILEQETARAIGSGAVALPMERERVRSAATYRQFFGGGVPYDMVRSAETLRTIASQRQLDAVLVWVPTIFEDHGARIRGVTLSAGIFGGGKMGSGVNAVLDVFDGTTGRLLAANVGNTTMGKLTARWRDEFSNFTPEERAEIRGEFQRQSREKALSAPKNLGLAQ